MLTYKYNTHISPWNNMPSNLLTPRGPTCIKLSHALNNRNKLPLIETSLMPYFYSNMFWNMPWNQERRSNLAWTGFECTKANSVLKVNSQGESPASHPVPMHHWTFLGLQSDSLWERTCTVNRDLHNSNLLLKTELPKLRHLVTELHLLSNHIRRIPTW